jgi:uncharacterized protein YbjT (DUF2867 family)
VDLRTGAGLDRALEGVDAIVDTTHAGSASPEEAIAFFTDVATHLQAAAARHGARHVVTLSIVGIDRPGAAAHPHYAAKLRHEQAALSGSVRATILRATQFHEFPAQMLRWNRQGNVSRIPEMRTQPVAARTVGEVLVELAEQAAETDQGASPTQTSIAPPARLELAGPGPAASLVSLANTVARRWLPNLTVEPTQSALSTVDLLPSPGARIAGPTFDSWLLTEDAAAAAQLLLSPD